MDKFDGIWDGTFYIFMYFSISIITTNHFYQSFELKYFYLPWEL